MNIVYTCDQNLTYIKTMVVSIVSVLANKKSNYDLNIYIVHTNVPEKYLYILKDLENLENEQIKKHSCKIIIINLNDYFSINLDSSNRGHLTGSGAAYRLFIPKLLPNEERALYLDTDTIVQQDLLDFYNQNLAGYYMAAKLISIHTTYGRNILFEGKTYLSEAFYTLILKLPLEAFEVGKTPYINSGVLLLNLREINANNKGQELIDLAQKATNFHLIDQDVLVSVFYNKIKDIGWHYNNTNVHETYGEHSRKKAIEYGKESAILHFISSAKPSKLKSIHKVLFYKEYYKYNQMSYFKVNPSTLKLGFLIAEIKRLRIRIFAIKRENPYIQIFLFSCIKLSIPKIRIRFYT